MTNIIFFKGSERPQLVAEIKAFRLKIWSKSIGLDKAILRFGEVVDAHDLRAWHLVKYDQQNIIASEALNVAYTQDELVDRCSFQQYITRMDFPLAVSNRLVVDDKYTRRGIRGEFYTLRVEKAKKLKLLEIWGEVEKRRTRFNLQNNYKDIGASSDESIAGDWRIVVKKLDE